MPRVGLLALHAALLVSLGVSADGQEGFSRLGTGSSWRAIRQFSLTPPAGAEDCRLACERSQVCVSWTMTRTPGRPPRAPRADMCVLQAFALPARRDACCTSGLRSSPLPTVAQSVSGPGEMYVANSSHTGAKFDMVYLRRDATPWQCRAACIEQAENAGPGGTVCSYWEFAPPGRADRFARCFYSASSGRFLRAGGRAAGGPVTR